MKICCATPLMASSVAPSFLASSNSLFFANGGSRSFSQTRLALVSRSRRHSAAVPRRPGECRCLFGLGVPELVVIAGVAALVFGPRKLPEIGRSIGKTVKSFQEAAKEFETELKREPGEVSEAASGEQLKAAASEGKEVKTSSTKENV